MSSTVRRPAVAGYFYPDDPQSLGREVDRLLADAVEAACHGPIRALMVPHAGYRYSGPTAAAGYAALKDRDDPIRIVLLGPAHRALVSGLAVPTVSAFQTPLGTVSLDLETLGELLELPQVIASDLPHLPEHSLEVQLPFLQRSFVDFRLVPLLVGDAGAEEVEQVLDRCVDDRTLLIVSTDLSHYLSYEEARRRDRDTLDRILAHEPTLAGEQACGCRAVNALARFAARRGWRPELIDYRNSGDTAGPRDRVVGYASVAWLDG